MNQSLHYTINNYYVVSIKCQHFDARLQYRREIRALVLSAHESEFIYCNYRIVWHFEFT